MKNNNPKGERKLKIHTQFLERNRIYTPYILRNNSCTYRKLPVIRLSGDWLKNIGFQCGQYILVTHEMNKITITLREEPQIPDHKKKDILK